MSIRDWLKNVDGWRMQQQWWGTNNKKKKKSLYIYQVLVQSIAVKLLASRLLFFLDSDVRSSTIQWRYIQFDLWTTFLYFFPLSLSLSLQTWDLLSASPSPHTKKKKSSEFPRTRKCNTTQEEMYERKKKVIGAVCCRGYTFWIPSNVNTNISFRDNSGNYYWYCWNKIELNVLVLFLHLFF